jgi:predicted ATPase/transcriptional regulator with XRE-family HTH domain/Tfp pilus assembly protein PilF
VEITQSLSFAAALKHFRLAAGLTQEGLAERAGLSRGAVSTLERGERKTPRKDTIAMLAQALGLTDEDRATLFAAATSTSRPRPRTASDDAYATPILTAPLPTPPTALLGRGGELAFAGELLHGEGVRMLTLTGPAGVGKTRLALAVAAAYRGGFVHGVAFVPLASLGEPSLLADTIARAVGAHERADQRSDQTLAAHLRDKHLLLVLDNFEHLIPAAPLLADLVATCPHLTLLVTSRTVLRLRCEHALPVPPLTLPDAATTPEPGTLAESPAVALFVERARAIRPDFALTPAVADDVAAICRRLDGLPLAIELAAARIRLLPPRGLLARLEQRLPLLVGGARDLPDRQRTMRDALAWSYDLLSPAEQVLFRRLGVFVGGATLDAVETVCRVGGELEADALEWLATLVDHNLLLPEAVTATEPRVAMLETMREYALELLAANGELDSLRHRHASYFQTLAEQSEIELQGPDQQAWLPRMELDHDNVRAAVRWALERGEFELGLRLVSGIRYFWHVCGHLTEGRMWTEEMLSRASSEAVSTVVRAKALNSAAWLAYAQTDDDRAALLAQQALALSRGARDNRGRAIAQITLALVAMNRGDYRSATLAQEEALSLFRELDDAWGIAACLNNLGLLASQQGDFARAAVLLEESLGLARARDDKRDVALSLVNLGSIRYAQGDLTRAQAFWADCLALYHELGGTLRDEIAFESLEGLAEIVAARGQASQATPLLAAAETLRATFGVPRPPAVRAAYDGAVAATRQTLTSEAFDTVWQEGALLSLDQAIATALAST